MGKLEVGEIKTEGIPCQKMIVSTGALADGNGIEMYEEIITETIVEEEYIEYCMMEDGLLRQREVTSMCISFYRGTHNTTDKCRHITVLFHDNPLNPLKGSQNTTSLV